MSYYILDNPKSGFVYSAPDYSDGLILRGSDDLSSGTIFLPEKFNDGADFNIFSTDITVENLSIQSVNGTIFGEVLYLDQNYSVTLKWISSNNFWFVI